MAIELLNKRIIEINIDAKNAEEAMDALSSRLWQLGYVKESFIEAVKMREREYATGLPVKSVGVAFPHTDFEHVNRSCVGVGVLSKPVQFKVMGTDEEFINVEVMFMLALKEQHSVIDILQDLIHLVQDEELLLKIKSSKTSSDVFKLLKKYFNTIRRRQFMDNKKRILVACGTGIATSIVVVKKVENMLRERGYSDKVSFSTCSVAELESKAADFDLIITTALCNKQLPTKVILGVVFLTGQGMEPVMQDIIDHLGLAK